MRPKLLILNGPLKGKKYEIPDGVTVVGRTASCNLVLPVDVVSRRHAQITYADGQATIKDLESHNGTLVNGKKVQEQILRDGDLINVSDVELKFVSPAEIKPPIAPPKQSEKTGVVNMREIVEAIGGQAKPSSGDNKESSIDENSDDPLLGNIIGSCLIKKLIGIGGMGKVYKAEHMRLRKPIAIKILSGEFGDNKDFVQRFYREARMAAILEHANIVSVYDVGEDKGLHYITMQYVDGISLSSYIQQKGKLDLYDALDILDKIARGLSCAESNNIVHRDIKPGNILLTKDGGTKIVDFGLSKNVSGATMLTEAGMLMGTPHYMSPEQCSGDVVDHRTDIYSLGATAYYMLSGEKPFTGNTPMEVIRLQKKGQLTPLKAANPEVPEIVAAIVAKMMAKDPKDRYQTNTEVIEAISNAQKQIFG